MPLPPTTDFKHSPADDLHARLAALRLHHEEVAAAREAAKAAEGGDNEDGSSSTAARPRSPPISPEKALRSSPPPYTEEQPRTSAPISQLDSTKDDLHERFTRLFGPPSLGSLSQGLGSGAKAVGIDGTEEDEEWDAGIEESLEALDEGHWERIERSRKEGTVGELDEGESVKNILSLLSGSDDVDWMLVPQYANLSKAEEDEADRLLQEAYAALPKHDPKNPPPPESLSDSDSDDDSDSHAKRKTEEQQVKEILSMEFDRLKLEAERGKRPRLDLEGDFVSVFDRKEGEDDDDGVEIPMPPSPPKSHVIPFHSSTSKLSSSSSDNLAKLNSLNLPPSPPRNASHSSLFASYDFPSVSGTAPDNDEEDNWCAICLADAEFACSGCEDLYCEACLWESHQGPDAGFEERRHKWTRVVPGKKKKEEEEKKRAIGVGG